MDEFLLNNVKNITKKYKSCSKNNLNFNMDDIQKKINELINVLFNIKIEKLTNCFTYTHQNNLIKSIKDLAQITLLLINEQNKKISATNNAINNKDNSMYFIVKETDFVTNSTIDCNMDINKAIDAIIIRRKNDYLNYFNYFKNEKVADVLIRKEFDDVINYLKVLLMINEIKFNKIDNFDPLINGCQNLMYELIQLVIILIEAEESKINRTFENSNIDDLKGYFIIMDFVNSRKMSNENKINSLIENIKKINILIEKEKNIGMLCKMNLYKQDEVHGIFIGNIDNLIEVIRNKIISDIKIAISEFNIFDNVNGIKNIVDSVYDNPFVFYGKPTWEAREIMNDNPLLIRVNQ